MKNYQNESDEEPQVGKKLKPNIDYDCLEQVLKENLHWSLQQEEFEIVEKKINKTKDNLYLRIVANHILYLFDDNYSLLRFLKLGSEITIHGYFFFSKNLMIFTFTKEDNNFFLIDGQKQVFPTNMFQPDGCRRKFFLDSQFPIPRDNTNKKPKKKGKVVHTFFEKMTKEENFEKVKEYSNLSLLELGKKISEEIPQDIFLVEFQNSIKWIRKYIVDGEQISFNNKQYRIINQIQTETEKKSQLYSLSARVDVLLTVQQVDNENVTFQIPLELKTGSSYESNNMQVQIQILILDPYNFHERFGLLLNLTEANTIYESIHKLVFCNNVDRKRIIMLRNKCIDFQEAQFVNGLQSLPKYFSNFSLLPNISNHIQQHFDFSNCSSCQQKDICLGLNFLSANKEQIINIQNYEDVKKKMNNYAKHWLNDSVQQIRKELKNTEYKEYKKNKEWKEYKVYREHKEQLMISQHMIFKLVVSNQYPKHLNVLMNRAPQELERENMKQEAEWGKKVQFQCRIAKNYALILGTTQEDREEILFQFLLFCCKDKKKIFVVFRKLIKENFSLKQRFLAWWIEQEKKKKSSIQYNNYIAFQNFQDLKQTQEQLDYCVIFEAPPEINQYICISWLLAGRVFMLTGDHKQKENKLLQQLYDQSDFLKEIQELQ